MNFQQIKQKWQTFWRSERGKSTAKILRYILLVVIVVYLIYQLTVIGWGEVWRNLPTNPLFYLLFLVMHFILPSTELFIYRLSLRLPLWEGFKVFTKKKVLNSDVLGYSGEAYFYVWGKKHLKENDKYIFNVIKDNNIISSFASTLMAVLLLTIFTYTECRYWSSYIRDYCDFCRDLFSEKNHFNARRFGVKNIWHTYFTNYIDLYIRSAAMDGRVALGAATHLAAFFIG